MMERQTRDNNTLHEELEREREMNRANTILNHFLAGDAYRVVNILEEALLIFDKLNREIMQESDGRGAVAEGPEQASA